MPEFPLGCVVKSSGCECIITVLPIISFTVNLFIKTDIKAYPLFEKVVASPQRDMDEGSL